MERVDRDTQANPNDKRRQGQGDMGAADYSMCKLRAHTDTLRDYKQKKKKERPSFARVCPNNLQHRVSADTLTRLNGRVYRSMYAYSKREMRDISDTHPYSFVTFRTRGPSVSSSMLPTSSSPGGVPGGSVDTTVCPPLVLVLGPSTLSV